jgi:choice-of-anchor C domain-containing protein
MVALYEATGEKDLAAKWQKEVPLKAKPEDNLLINGSFEEGPEVSNYVALDAGSTAMPGWVVTRDQIDVVGYYWAAASGKRSIDLHGSPGFGGVAQTFKTQKGKRYQVVFSLAGTGDVKVKRTGVSAAGQTREFSFDSTDTTYSDMGWEKQVWEFEAIADETTLEIYTLENTEGLAGPVIDDVWVLPVPEK